MRGFGPSLCEAAHREVNAACWKVLQAATQCGNPASPKALCAAGTWERGTPELKETPTIPIAPLAPSTGKAYCHDHWQRRNNYRV